MPSCTHAVVLPSDVQVIGRLQNYKQIQVSSPSPIAQIVHPLWLYDSCCYKKMLDPTDYLINAAKIPATPIKDDEFAQQAQRDNFLLCANPNPTTNFGIARNTRLSFDNDNDASCRRALSFGQTRLFSQCLFFIYDTASFDKGLLEHIKRNDGAYKLIPFPLVKHDALQLAGKRKTVLFLFPDSPDTKELITKLRQVFKYEFTHYLSYRALRHFLDFNKVEIPRRLLHLLPLNYETPRYRDYRIYINIQNANDKVLLK